MKKQISFLLLILALIFAVGAERMEKPLISPLIAVILALLVGFYLKNLNPIKKPKWTMVMLLSSLAIAYVLSPILGLLLALSFPLVLAGLMEKAIPRKEQIEPKNEEMEEVPKKPFTREIPSTVVIRASRSEAEEIAAMISKLLVRSLYKLVVVDRSGRAVEILQKSGIPFRASNPDEIEFLYPGKLRESFPVMLASILSGLTGVIPSLVVVAASKGKWDILLKDQTTPDSLRLAIGQIVGPERFLLKDLIPRIGPLVVDLSKLESEFSKELATLLVLLQASVIEYRDFIIVASLFRSLQREVLRGETKDAILQLIESLSLGGAVICTTYEVDPSVIGCFSSLMLLHPTNLAANRPLADVLRTMSRDMLEEIHKLSGDEGLFIKGRPIKIVKFKMDDLNEQL